MNYDNIKELVVNLAYPGRMARNMVPLRERHVANGIIELQTKIPKLQELNSNVYSGDDNFNCGAIQIAAPNGEIFEVEAFRVDAPNEDIETACECVCQYTVGSYEGIKSLCSQWSECGGAIKTDSDGNTIPMHPVDRGIFAVWNGELWAYPAPLTPWRLRVRWRGIRQSFDGDDEVDLSESQISLLARWVEWQGAIDDRCWTDAERLQRIYLVGLRDEYLRVRRTENPPNPMYIRRAYVGPRIVCGSCTTAYNDPMAT